MSEMPEETRKAVLESITHWRREYEEWKRTGVVPAMTADQCALCERFKIFPRRCDRLSNGLSELCPAAKGSSGGQKYCRGTPYTGAPDSDAEFADEIAYLESLLEGTK